MPAEQALFYAGQVPNGLFVLLAGRVRVAPGLELSGPPLCVIPPLSAIEEPAKSSALTAQKSEFLFVPRSVLLFEPTIRALIDEMIRLVGSGRPVPKPF